MKEIQLTQGKVALIDDEMFDRVSYFKWYATKHGRTFYAVTTISLGNGKEKKLSVHNLIIGCPIRYTDHVDGDGLNNQKSNLRLATATQNQGNTVKQSGCTSKYKGVSWAKTRNKWKASIEIKGRNNHLGVFDPDQEHMAAMAYDLAAIEYFGEFAKTNLSIYNNL